MKTRALFYVFVGLLIIAGTVFFLTGNGLAAILAWVVAGAAGITNIFALLDLVRRWLANWSPSAAVQAQLRRPAFLTQQREVDWDASPPFLYEGDVQSLVPPARCGDWIGWPVRGMDALWTEWEMICTGRAEHEVLLEQLDVVVDQVKPCPWGRVVGCTVGGADAPRRNLFVRIPANHMRVTAGEVLDMRGNQPISYYKSRSG